MPSRHQPSPQRPSLLRSPLSFLVFARAFDTRASSAVTSVNAEEVIESQDAVQHEKTSTE
jgi:hypothetical protein